MSDMTIEKLQVIIEATTAPFRKEVEKVKKLMAEATKDIDKEMAKVNKATEQVNKKVNDAMKPVFENKSYKQMQSELAKSEKQIERFREQQEILKSTSKNMRLSDEYQSIVKHLDNVNARISKIQDKIRNATNYSKRMGLNDQLGEYQKERSFVEQDYADIVEEGGVYQPSEAWIKCQKQIEIATAKADMYRQAVAQASEGKDLDSYGNSGKMGGMKNTFSKITDGIKKCSGAFSSLINKFKNGLPHIDKAKKSMNGMGMQGKGLSGVFATLGMTARFMFASFVIMGAINSAKVGLQNLAQYSSETNQNISLLMSSLTQLKNAIATAFAPILTIATPYLNTLIQWLISATTAVAHLFAALTGQNTFTVAKKIQQDYASSLDKSAKSASNLKDQLMGFDEINKLSSDASNSSDGTVSPSDMFDTVEVESKYKGMANKIKSYLTPVTEAFANLYNNGLAKLENFAWGTLNDFYKSFLLPVGEWTIGEGLPRFIKITNDMLMNTDFDRLKGSLDGLYKALSNLSIIAFDALLDFYEYFLSPLGSWFMGEALPRLVDIMTDFVNTVDWQKINDALERFWKALEPLAESVGEGIIDFYDSLFDIGADFINKTVPSALNKLADALERLDKEDGVNIGFTIGGISFLMFGSIIIKSILGFFKKTFLFTVLKEFGKGLLTSFLSGFSAGGIVSGIATAITSGISMLGGPGTPSFDLIFDGIIKFADKLLDEIGFKLPSEIESKITKMGALAIIGAIAGPIGALVGAILGLIWDSIESSGGIKKYFSDIGETFVNALFGDADEGVFRWAKGFFVYAQDCFKEAKKAFEDNDWASLGINILNGILAGISGALTGVFEPIAHLFDAIVRAICAIFGVHSPAKEMEPYGENILKGILVGIENAISGVPEKVKKLYDELIRNIKEKFGELKQAIEEKYKDIGDWFESNVAPKFTVSYWEGKFDSILQGFKNKIGELKQSITDRWGEIKSWWDNNVKLPDLSFSINASTDGIKSAVNAIIDSMNSHVIGKIKLEIPDWVPFGLGGTTLGPPPNIPRFENGGFPEDGWFRASKGEYFGQFDDGTSYIANNKQITSGVAIGVYNAVMAAYANQKTNNSGNVTVVLEGDAKGMFKLVQQQATSYHKTTGKPPF